MPANPALSVFRTALVDPTDRGVVGEWRFERNTGYEYGITNWAGLMPDSSGRGYNGQFFALSNTDFLAGPAGPGYRFGTNEGGYHSAILVPTSWPVGGTEMSVEALFLLTSTGLFQAIVDKIGYTSGYRLIMFNDNTLAFQSGGSGATNIFSAALSANTVYHALGVVNTSDNPTRRLYLNGVQVASTANGTALSDAGQLYFGRDPGDAYPLFGHIYFVRVYNRALSAMEVQRRYALLAGRREKIQPDRWNGHLAKAAAGGGGGGARAFAVVIG